MAIASQEKVVVFMIERGWDLVFRSVWAGMEMCWNHSVLMRMSRGRSGRISANVNGGC